MIESLLFALCAWFITKFLPKSYRRTRAITENQKSLIRLFKLERHLYSCLNHSNLMLYHAMKRGNLEGGKPLHLVELDEIRPYARTMRVLHQKTETFTQEFIGFSEQFERHRGYFWYLVPHYPETTYVYARLPQYYVFLVTEIRTMIVCRQKQFRQLIPFASRVTPFINRWSHAVFDAPSCSGALEWASELEDEFVHQCGVAREQYHNWEMFFNIRSELFHEYLSKHRRNADKTEDLPETEL